MDERWTVILELAPPTKNKLEAAERALKGEDYGAEYVATKKSVLLSVDVSGQFKAIVKMFLVGRLMTQFYVDQSGSYHWEAPPGVEMNQGERLFFVLDELEEGGGRAKVTLVGMR